MDRLVILQDEDSVHERAIHARLVETFADEAGKILDEVHGCLVRKSCVVQRIHFANEQHSVLLIDLNAGRF